MRYPLVCLCLFLCCTLIRKDAAAQTVYFQRFASGAGTVSSVSPLGPSTTLTDLAGSLGNARLGGVDTNGAGLVFYVDRSANQILAVDAARNIFAILLPFSGLSNPQAISLDAFGNFLYVADVGNGRIVRVNLSSPLPANKVQVVVDASAGVTNLVEDLKYNPSDGYLYWTNDGAFHRAAVRGQSMPVQSGETILTTNSIGVRYFDFDLGNPQQVFFSSGSGGFEGIYRASIPRIGDTPTVNEVSVLNTSSTPDVTISGVAVDKNSSFLCFTALNTPAPVLRCGDRVSSALSDFPVILSSEFSVPPSFMTIESPSMVVNPQTKLSAPILQLNIAIPRPELTILLREFDLAILRAAQRFFTKATAGKVDFRYVVEVNRSADANGNRITDGKRDRRNRISMKNLVTAKNLAPNSTYQVRYNIEITLKKKGEAAKVVKKTALSPFSSVVVPMRSKP